MRTALAAALVTTLLAAGCAAPIRTEFTRISAGSYHATAPESIPVLAQIPANRRAEVIGMLNLRASGTGTTYEELLAQARARAGEAGAHALIDVRTGETPLTVTAGTTTVTHHLRTVAATAIRFLD